MQPDQNSLPKPKKPIGRPSSYKPEYSDMLISFFDQPLTKTIKKTYTTKAGTVIEEDVEKPNHIPTFEMFAHSLKTTVKTLIEWSEKYEDFGKAYTRAKQLQKNFLSQNALNGGYNPVFSKFWAINCLGMSDKQEIDHSGKLEFNVISFREKPPDKVEEKPDK